MASNIISQGRGNDISIRFPKVLNEELGLTSVVVAALGYRNGEARTSMRSYQSHVYLPTSYFMIFNKTYKP